jgi:hypothetical protein
MNADASVSEQTQQEQTKDTSNPSISVHTKVNSVLRLLEGGSAEALAAELEISPERLQGWKERFVEGGRAALLRRRTDERRRSEKRRKTAQHWAAVVAVLIGLTWLATWVFSNSD